MPTSHRPRPPPELQQARSLKTIVVVEDVVDLLEVTARVLEDEGYLVLCAEDAETGVRLAAETRADLVLLDYAMPYMSGAAAGRALRALETGDRLKIVMTSATPESQVRREFDGYDEFLPKPAPPADLVEIVAALLDR